MMIASHIQRSWRTHSILLQVVPPPALDELLTQMLLEPAQVAAEKVPLNKRRLWAGQGVALVRQN